VSRAARLGLLAALTAAAALVIVVQRPPRMPLPAPAAMPEAAEPSSVPPPSAAEPAPHLVPGGLMHSTLVTVVPWPAPPREPDALDRIAYAVERVESSLGRDPLMWRSDPRLPQGPMQVSEAAALDVGGGNRFDLDENRALGRAYLKRMYARYGDWRDSVMAYNWGPANVDRWIAAGRPADELNDGVLRYVDRVLYRDGEIANGEPPSATAAPVASAPAVDTVLPEIREESIGDPRLRRKVAENNRMLTQLSAFLDATAASSSDDGDYDEATVAWLKSIGTEPQLLAAGDAAARQSVQQAGIPLVFTIARAVSGRPGYANFRPANPARATANISGVRLIASVLARKLAQANATLALIDSRPHSMKLRRPLPKPAKARPIDG
jgi:hypothetical protein